MAAYPFDADVYKFLLRVSLLVPGAIRPIGVPNFVVPYACLLRFVETVITTETQKRLQQSNNENKVQWLDFFPNRKLMTHQVDAVSDMLARDSLGATGHFLVMDTGFGKTLTTVQYLFELKKKGQLPPSVLWVIPNSAVDAIVQELRKCGAPAEILPKTGSPIRGKFNVIPHDRLLFATYFVNCFRLRKVVQALMVAAPSMATVFDEVDTCYSKTQRTSAAHQIAALSPIVVCQTATPMRNTRHEELASWLARTATYPVTKENWWVAANSIVAKQIDLGIEVVFEEEHAPFATSILAGYRKACMEGQWLTAARLVWDVLDSIMVTVAKEKLPSFGGVLMEARDEQHRNLLVSMLKNSGVHAGSFLEGTNASVDVVVVRKVVVKMYRKQYSLFRMNVGATTGQLAWAVSFVVCIREMQHPGIR